MHVCCPPLSTLFPYTTLFRSDGKARAPQSDRMSGDRRVGPKPPPPQRIADNYHPMLSELIFRFEERAANSGDRKSTRLNSSHVEISYAVFCLKYKNQLLYFRF